MAASAMMGAMRMLIESRDAVDTVLIHPAFDRAFFVTEHPAGELDALGDALGCDCIVARLDHGWRWHAGDGSRNEDWYSWRVPVLAPCQATIERVQHPSGTTQPGQPAHHPPGQIVFRCDDETHVVYGHVDGIIVQVGDMVQAGQLVAVVGNNGFAW